MYVKSLMSKRVFTVDIDDSLLDVKALLENSKLPHLLVLEDFKLVGVISDRDYLKATGPALGSAAETAHDRAALQKRVHQVMTRNPITLTPDDKIIDAIKIFNTKFISSIPIINEQHRPVGTLSWFDILKALDPDYKDGLPTIFTEEPAKGAEVLNTEVKQTVIQIQKLPHGEGLDMPFYATAHAAGADLRAAIDEDVTLQPGEHKLIKTGFAMALAEGYEAQVRPRSGLAYKHGITVLNSPGTIDADYRGEVGVILINHGKEPFVITRGERIAQMVVAQFVQGSFSEVSELSETVRGEGGFGSSGRK